MNTYVITYENNATHTIQATSLVEAIESSKAALLDCVSKDFDPNNLVRAIAAKQLITEKDFEQSFLMESV
jgi:hypothetical protein